MKRYQKQFRHQRVKKNLKLESPRLVIFRSNKHIYAQIIDDSHQVTRVAASDLKNKTEKQSNLEKARGVGLALAKNALKKNIKKIVFDRAGYKYHGRIKALATGAREGGLEF